jgi:hypothetical protein
MKRSEFQSKLEEILIEYAPNMPPDFYVATADAIFRMTEEVGMLPPFSGYIEQQDIWDRWGLNTGKKEFIRVIVNKWESEDSTTNNTPPDDDDSGNYCGAV